MLWNANEISYLCMNILKRSLSFSCPPLYCAPNFPHHRSLLRSSKKTRPNSTTIASAWRNWSRCAAAVSPPRRVSSDSSTLGLHCNSINNYVSFTFTYDTSTYIQIGIGILTIKILLTRHSSDPRGLASSCSQPERPLFAFALLDQFILF